MEFSPKIDSLMRVYHGKGYGWETEIFSLFRARFLLEGGTYESSRRMTGPATYCNTGALTRRRMHECYLNVKRVVFVNTDLSSHSLPRHHNSISYTLSEIFPSTLRLYHVHKPIAQAPPPITPSLSQKIT